MNEVAIIEISLVTVLITLFLVETIGTAWRSR
jgi:hypothetical protein